MLDYVSSQELKSQTAWLTNDLNNTRQSWKLVFFHRPPYYSKNNRPNNDLLNAYQPIFDKYHVDLVFNGHDHCVARTVPLNNGKTVDDPAKGTVYYITGRSGSKYYKDSTRQIWDAFFYNPTDQPNYVTVEVNSSALTVKAVKQNGNVLDTYTIAK